MVRQFGVAPHVPDMSVTLYLGNASPHDIVGVAERVSPTHKLVGTLTFTRGRSPLPMTDLRGPPNLR